MERLQVTPRPDWVHRCEDLGFSFHSLDPEAGKYWDESIVYHLTAAEVDELEDATAILHHLCLEAVDYVVTNRQLDRLAIPPQFQEFCMQSWQQRQPSLYGRFDLFYDGQSPPKLLEYNADTPTALLEASVIQWAWLNETHPDRDQFNSIHEQLLEVFRALDRDRYDPLYFTCVEDSLEDLGTVEYLRDVAIQAGLTTAHIFIEDIGWDETRQCFCDLEGRRITRLFKLYPWEWLMAEDFAPYLLSGDLTLIEPAWKLLLSNKGILPILWELFPDHPNLLPSYFQPDHFSSPYLSKPFFSREGANITLYQNGSITQTPGSYGEEGVIYQAYTPPPQFDRAYPVIGSWIIGDRPAGIGIRESYSPITSNISRFVPHYF